MKRIQILDYGRFAAAIAVLSFHYTFNGIKNGKITSITGVDWLVEWTRYGYLGVAFFFMISGYVIFYSARDRGAPRFLASRAQRLFPAYWGAIVFTSIFAVFYGGELMAVRPFLVISNFTMLQNHLGLGNVDGVYWTLSYELSFYVAIALLLFLGLNRHLGKFFLVWPFLIVGARWLGFENANLLLHYYYLYFAAGGLFALITEKATVTRIACLGATAFFCVQIGSKHFSQIPAAVIIGSFFAFFGLCFLPSIRNFNLPYSKQCGAITYPLYLIHAHFGYMMLNLFANDDNKGLVYPLLLTVVLVLAWALHQLLESKLSLFWSHLFSRAIESPLLKLEHRMAPFKRRFSKYCRCDTNKPEVVKG